MNALLNRNNNIHRTHEKVPGGTMSAVHFGPAGEPVRLVFLNANGFHGLAYRTVLESLGVHVIALDLRGHGHTALPIESDNLAKFHNYAQDVAEYLRAHVEGKIVLAGHSLGASTAILTALKAPDKITKTLSLDPIILPTPVRFGMKFLPVRKYLRKNFPIARNAGRRRDEFPSFEAVYERYHGRGPFKNFPDEALWDYVSGGFVKHGDGVRLACRPLWEQFTYTIQGHSMMGPIAALPKSSRIIITDFVKQNRRWIGKMRAKRPGITIEHRPDLDHFFPLINPEISVAALKESLGL